MVTCSKRRPGAAGPVERSLLALSTTPDVARTVPCSGENAPKGIAGKLLNVSTPTRLT